MITIESYYGDSAAQESNAKVVKIDDVSLYFSYETLIGFDLGDGSGLKRVKNYWGPTTGKQLNAIDGGSTEAKDKRMEKEAFYELAEKLKIVIS